MIKIARIKQTLVASPTLWEGPNHDGGYVYIRHQYGVLSVSVYRDVVYAQRVNALNKTLSTAEMIQHTGHIIDWSEAG
jgi:hypothetical protein